MTTFVATSPTLRPFASEGIVPQLSHSPPTRQSFASFTTAVQKQLPCANDASVKATSQSVAVKGFDSADVEARRQEKAEILAERSTSSGDPAAQVDAGQGVAAAALEVRANSCPEAARGQTDVSLPAATPIPITASEDDPQGPFEGPEKLMELWFADCPELLPAESRTATFTILHGVDGKVFDGAVPKQRVGLRSVQRNLWEEMLDLVHCKVLSVVEGDDFDAYLLSESSMFVFPHKIILKTCGTTTLLLGLQRILELAQYALGKSTSLNSFSVHPTEAALEHSESEKSETEADRDRRSLGALVRQCFYSRKSFMFPERQKGPHRDWQLEVRLLDAFFSDGSAYTVGKMNGDHWLLYMCCPGDKESSQVPYLIGEAPVERPMRLPDPPSFSNDVDNDQTLEILMTHLAPAACAQFEFPQTLEVPSVKVGQVGSSDRGHVLGMGLSEQLGLTDLYPSTELDAFAFEPCGYSANAVIPESSACSAGYWTIHVTPEVGSSYASFETNIRLSHDDAAREGISQRSADDLVQKIVRIFRPGKLSITLFTSRRSHSHGDREALDQTASGTALDDDTVILDRLRLPGFLRKDRIAYEFESYDLMFLHFEEVATSLKPAA